MDYETKLILQDLIKAVEKLDSPDWWIIVLTIINIGAFVVVAWTQIKLQKRQEKLQQQQISLSEYDINKKLYSVIRDIDELSDTVIMRIYLHFFGIFKRDFLGELQNEIEDVKKRLSDSLLDLELRLDSGIKGCNSYEVLIRNMSKLVSCMQAIETKKAINTPGIETNKTNDKEIRSEIIKCIDNKYQETINTIFEEFDKQKQEVKRIKILKQIKDRIAPIRVK